MKRTVRGGAAGAWLISAVRGFSPRAARIEFPRDHGAHPEAPVEWWYYTGHLREAAGREHGFQLTFFRVRDIHLAHFAWTRRRGKEVSLRREDAPRPPRHRLGGAGPPGGRQRGLVRDGSSRRAPPARLRARGTTRPDAAAAQASRPARRSGPVAQGPRQGGVLPVRFDHPPRGPRDAFRREERADALRDGLVRPRMGTRGPARRSRRLGLVCAPARRRVRADALSHAAGGRRRDAVLLGHVRPTGRPSGSDRLEGRAPREHGSLALSTQRAPDTLRAGKSPSRPWVSPPRSSPSWRTRSSSRRSPRA